MTYEWQVRTNCGGEVSTYSPICSFTAGDSNSSACAGERLAIAEVQAYPNPAHGSVRIEVVMDGEAPISLMLSDVFGRLILQREMEGERVLDLDVSGLNAGMYLVRATNGAQEKVLRLVVE